MLVRPLALALVLSPFVAGCSGAQRGGDPDLAHEVLVNDLGAHDQSIAPVDKVLVVNEVRPNGPDPLTDPDWVELKNISTAPVSLKDYTLADSATSSPLPDVQVAAGGYVVVLCDDAPDAGGLAGIHAPFKLKAKGDEVHLRLGGAEADHTSWTTNDVPDGKTWARLPDGTGNFAAATPTQLATNAP